MLLIFSDTRQRNRFGSFVAFLTIANECGPGVCDKHIHYLNVHRIAEASQRPLNLKLSACPPVKGQPQPLTLVCSATRLRPFYTLPLESGQFSREPADFQSKTASVYLNQVKHLVPLKGDNSVSVAEDPFPFDLYEMVSIFHHFSLINMCCDIWGKGKRLKVWNTVLVSVDGGGKVF